MFILKKQSPFVKKWPNSHALANLGCLNYYQLLLDDQLDTVIRMSNLWSTGLHCKNK